MRTILFIYDNCMGTIPLSNIKYLDEFCGIALIYKNIWKQYKRSHMIIVWELYQQSRTVTSHLPLEQSTATITVLTTCPETM